MVGLQAMQSETPFHSMRIVLDEVACRRRSCSFPHSIIQQQLCFPEFLVDQLHVLAFQSEHVPSVVILASDVSATENPTAMDQLFVALCPVHHARTPCYRTCCSGRSGSRGSSRA